MQYSPADLTPAEIKRLQELERDLSDSADGSIVVVAYKRSAENEKAGSNLNGSEGASYGHDSSQS
ncbi:hypothetical protein [Paenibacillus humicola]|uniref:hypothetical protein n=1 Tax=Paenibacillus humicola TaxID=3110540 RepID=UPI00237C2049|nr:hypothetical protein [Paenibacillus humicola]